jgi:UDP:flavonoid glycosyltransferase YjiC (YdhE family)
MRPENIVNQRILISPLNWGMGHVARCIGMIHQLRNQGNEIFIACDEAQKVVFEVYFEGITFLSHDGYPFYFGGKGQFGLDLLRRMKSLSKRLNRERIEVEEMVVTHKIDYVVSDHRYGFISSKVPSIFMTHQVNLPLKWYEMYFQKMHRKLTSRFDIIWILDDEKSSLAGKLSANCPMNGMYIGPYSRFSIYDGAIEKKLDHVLIVSGPDIYARKLIHKVLDEREQFPNLTIIHSTNLNISPLDAHEVKGSWKEKDEAIRAAKHIISYSGYSTLMDCRILDVATTFYPTKGQAEQEYLAKRWKEKFT